MGTPLLTRSAKKKQETSGGEKKPVLTRRNAMTSRRLDYIQATKKVDKGTGAKSSNQRSTTTKASSATKPSTSTGGQTVTKKQVYLIDTENEDGDEEEPWYEHDEKKGKKACKPGPKTENTIAKVMADRTKLMSTLTESVSAIASRQPVEKTNEGLENADLLWAKSLSCQMARMSQDNKDTFMLRVSQLVFEAIRGEIA